jgi:DNA-binding NarL/FixJ family response regulator
MSIRVVLADDQALVRGGLRALIDAEADLIVAGEATDGEQAIAVIRDARPDVVLMDIRMPGMDGLEATRQVAADDALSGVRVMVLTTFEVDEYVFAALRAGASGFLLKDAEPSALLNAIRVVASGEALLSPSVTRRVVEVFAAASTPDAPQASLLAELTGREREVVGLVAAGLSNADIAQHLVISPATARTHVSRAMVKLGSRDRAQLVVFAYESGIVAPGRPAA